MSVLHQPGGFSCEGSRALKMTIIVFRRSQRRLAKATELTVFTDVGTRGGGHAFDAIRQFGNEIAHRNIMPYPRSVSSPQKAILHSQPIDRGVFILS